VHTRLATFHRVVMVQVLKEAGYLAQFLIFCLLVLLDCHFALLVDSI
jgi:hypothetical protein